MEFKIREGSFDCVIAKFLEVSMVSAVSCSLLRRVWQLCNLPCVYNFFLPQVWFTYLLSLYVGCVYLIRTFQEPHFMDIIFIFIQLFLKDCRSFASRKLCVCQEMFVCFLRIFDWAYSKEKQTITREWDCTARSPQ